MKFMKSAMTAKPSLSLAMLVPASLPLADNGFLVNSKQPTHICGWLGSERGENRFRGYGEQNRENVMTLAESQSKDLTYQQLLDSDTHS